MTNPSTEPADELQAFINELDQIPWFQNLGQPIFLDSIKQVTNLEEALSYLQDEAWTYATFHDHITSDHPAWENAYDRAKDAAARKLAKLNVSSDEIALEDAAAYDAAGAAYELATNSKDRFFVDVLMKWYRLGHWPCGWDGHYPDGKLIVF